METVITEPKECKGCNSTGDCPRCDGIGRLWTNHKGEKNIGRYDRARPEDPCRRCGGNGICPGCGGSGWVRV